MRSRAEPSPFPATDLQGQCSRCQFSINPRSASSRPRVVRKPVVADLADGGEAIVVHPVGNLAMSWDHRAFDGGWFLASSKEIFETRDWMAEL